MNYCTVKIKDHDYANGQMPKHPLHPGWLTRYKLTVNQFMQDYWCNNTHQHIGHFDILNARRSTQPTGRTVHNDITNFTIRSQRFLQQYIPAFFACRKVSNRHF